MKKVAVGIITSEAKIERIARILAKEHICPSDIFFNEKIDVRNCNLGVTPCTKCMIEAFKRHTERLIEVG